MITRKNPWWSRKAKPNYKSGLTKEAALAAGIARALNITDAQVRNFGPFMRLHIENRSAVVVSVHFDGSPLGDNSVSGAQALETLSPGDIVDLTPYENGEPDITFTRITIKNEDAAAATAASSVSWWIANR